ncbi:MAG: acyl-CoA dehydrogenase family protein [Thermaerobacter sp.]|nr:acyl-CoA dehydrogenase family protein [Thermaerobacter sp.]
MDTQQFTTLEQEVGRFVQGPARELGENLEKGQASTIEAWQEIRRQEYLKLAPPEVLGGKGLSMTQYLTLLEKFSAMHGSLRMIVHVMNGIWRPVYSHASQSQIEEYVKPLIQGTHIVTFTLTEPNAGTGSDIQTDARREGSDYIVNGEKWLITFADVADYFLLFGRLQGTQGAHGTLALMVPRDADGLQIEAMPPSMGLSGTGHGHLYLQNCRVPVASRLGEEGEGLDVAFHGFLDPSRLGIGMTTVGLAQRALDLAIERANTRVTFGKALAQRSTIRERLAEMATDVEAARQLCLWAARRWDAGCLAPEDASKAKLFGSEMLQRVTDRALQIFGGIGYFHGYEIERIYRDARAQRFEEGTAEVQKAVIGRSLVRSPRSVAKKEPARVITY